ncbi:C6 zinc finger domain-containing protein [Coccidioides immitis RS]|uniref:C6 zinc finger domain-containing protein n=1 Tax=Coccidioides immitis (strain RS) TaxID=246410 RepID=J3K1V8_COCIM|nr:C6 zinc finger domain-containing protein [Coccidioides immitis RS]EAS28014.3 C6 zinc finger domain-containing protein [Coccidioides immitis RS]
MDQDNKTEMRLERPPAGKGTRKKFTKPPVKVACLSCRASRIRCDGKDPCSGCTLKGKDCSYLPSRRGGPRKKKVIPAASVAMESSESKIWSVVHPIPRLDEELFNQVDTLAVPGAGLRALDFPNEVQSMLEGLFMPGSSASYPALASEPVPTPLPPSAPTRVRVYGSEQDILNGYYTFIHDYFPVFPPPHAPQGLDSPLELPSSPDMTSDNPPLVYHPKSPVTLAISAVLARVPHPADPDPSSSESILIRRAYSHRFARAALDSVEAESELTESCDSPAQALLNEQPIPKRLPVHPNTPVELESILALLILSVYEYTQRGNLVKMRNRAGEAYVKALNMSLHTQGREDDIFAEARRRAWWMTFYCVCQGSIVSNTAPAILVTDPHFVTPLPLFSADSDAWAVLVQAQQVLVSATQYVCDLNRALRGRADMSRIYERVKKLDFWALAALSQANIHPPPHVSALDAYRSEAITANSVRAIARIKISSARIKIHRFRAFLDIPIFIKKHCDLTCASIGSADTESTSTEQRADSKVSCCSASLSQVPTPSDISPSVSPPASDASTYSWVSEESFPFSNYDSTSICLESALTIAQMFDSLPYPHPPYGDRPPGGFTPSCDPMPRTMPSFACCAMQSSYAMLMLYYKSCITKHNAENTPLSNTDQLRERLRHGLRCVIDAVKNYAIAFEALDGMRDEIEGAFLTAFPQP